jgi:hypothetical protein
MVPGFVFFFVLSDDEIPHESNVSRPIYEFSIHCGFMTLQEIH